MGIDKYNAEGCCSPAGSVKHGPSREARHYDPTTYNALTNIHRDVMAADKKAAYRPLVYICSPYAGDTVRNVANARKYSRFAFEQNTIPIAAHLLFPQFMDDDNPTERQAAMHFNYVLLGKCEELWVFGETISDGMAHEIGIAKKRRQKIRYFRTNVRRSDNESNAVYR